MKNKKVLILNESPRKDGNTEQLVRFFKNGCIDSGKIVIQFDIYNMAINPCIGCMQGGKSIEQPCMQKDDMTDIYNAFIKSDIVCFSSPVYFWSVCGPLKTVIDRLYAFKECDGKLKMPYKKTVLLMAAGGKRVNHVETWFEALNSYLGWNLKGCIICKNRLKAGEIDGAVELEEAYRLGIELE